MRDVVEGVLRDGVEHAKADVWTNEEVAGVAAVEDVVGSTTMSSSESSESSKAVMSAAFLFKAGREG